MKDVLTILLNGIVKNKFGITDFNYYICIVIKKTMTIRELAPFIKSSVDELVKRDDGTTFRMILDENFAVYVGWGDGFDVNDETAIHSKSQPSYCVCVKVAENIPNFSWEDAYMPWYEDGEVYDTDCSISNYDNKKKYHNIAKWLLSSYREMRRLLKKGIITF